MDRAVSLASLRRLPSTLLAALALCLSLLAAPSASVAQSPLAAPAGPSVLDAERPPREPSTAGETWYGWQTLTADALSLSLALAGGSDLDRVARLGFFLAPPVIHFAHAHFGLGLASLGLRVVGTVGTAALWLSTCWDLGFGDTIGRGDGFACEVALPMLAIISLLGPIALDAALAWDEPARRSRARGRPMTISPWATASGSSGIAVAGRF